MSLETRIRVLTTEGLGLVPRLSDEHLNLIVEYHGALFDAAVAEASRRRKEKSQVKES
jgi:hypothetical protein